MVSRLTQYLCTAAVCLAMTLGTAHGQDLVYTPKNPAFGGSPVNYQWMLNSANAQNAFEQERDRFRRDPLANFEQSLQRQILSQLSRELVSDRFGGLDFSQEGRFDIGDFTVDVTPGLDGLSVRIFNKLTGDESTITVPNSF